MRPPQIILDFRDLVETAQDIRAIGLLLVDVAREFGFDRVAMLHTRSLLGSVLRCSPHLIRFDNYPDDWDRNLIGPGMKIVDPILLTVRRRASGLLWPDDLQASRLPELQRSILDHGRHLGIRQGITVPANVPGEPEGSISFATCSTRQASREEQAIIDAIARIAFDAARRARGLDMLPDPVPHVTDRERECIYWIAHGKSDQDIADILGIALESIRTYIKRAFRKLGVVTRGQLVHEALRLGVIDTLPSCPPFG